MNEYRKKINYKWMEKIYLPLTNVKNKFNRGKAIFGGKNKKYIICKKGGWKKGRKNMEKRKKKNKKLKVKPSYCDLVTRRHATRLRRPSLHVATTPTTCREVAADPATHCEVAVDLATHREVAMDFVTHRDSGPCVLSRCHDNPMTRWVVVVILMIRHIVVPCLDVSCRLVCKMINSARVDMGRHFIPLYLFVLVSLNFEFSWLLNFIVLF